MPKFQVTVTVDSNRHSSYPFERFENRQEAENLVHALLNNGINHIRNIQSSRYNQINPITAGKLVTVGEPKPENLELSEVSEESRQVLKSSFVESYRNQPLSEEDRSEALQQVASDVGVPEAVIEKSLQRKRTLEDLIKDAWQIQNACNPIAVALAVHEAMVDLRRIYPNAQMVLIQYHPIVFMFYHKLADMLGDPDIYNEVKAKFDYLASLHGVELQQ